MKIKTVFLLMFLALILVVILFLKNQTQTPGQIQEVKQINPTPSVQANNFRIISTNLSGNSIGLTEPISLTFSQSVSNSFVYKITPQKEVQIKAGTNLGEVIIDPVDAWNFNTNYSLTIFKSSLSTNNLPLDQDYVYTFKTPAYSGI